MTFEKSESYLQDMIEEKTGLNVLIKDEVHTTVGYPIFPSILIAKYLSPEA